MKIMDNFDDDLSLKQKEFVEPIDKATNKDLFEKKDEFKEVTPKVVHLNSLITKNIYLFTKDPNYKLFALLMANDSSIYICLLYTSPSPRDATLSRMPSSA